MNLLLIRFKHDCEHLSDEMELNIMEKYTKQTKIYAYAIVGNNENIYEKQL